MCVIAVSAKGSRQPNRAEITQAFVKNPDGAGYMFARDGKVHIRKGYMKLRDLMEALDNEHFTKDDSVVYHFRISTQAGVSPEMTHPFPIYHDIRAMDLLSVRYDMAVAHNGIISLTSNKTETHYSDTAIFIADYMSQFIKSARDIHNRENLDLIYDLAKSKFALMDGNGDIETVGQFTEDDGILWSNTSYKPAPVHRKYFTFSRQSVRDPDFWESADFTDYLIPQE